MGGGRGSTGSIVNTSEYVFNQLCNYILTYKLRDTTQDVRNKMSKNVNFIYWELALVFMDLQVACRLAELVTLIKLRPFHSYFEHYIRQHKL